MGDGSHGSIVETPADENVWLNALWDDGTPTFSIAIPSYKDDASSMIASLCKCDRIKDVEIIVFDDGAGDPDLLDNMNRALQDAPCPAKLVSASKNAGRSAARNRLIAHTRAPWLLLLDADMLPDFPDFLSVYLKIIEDGQAPGLVLGGFSLKQAPTDECYALHRWQAARSECLSAAERSVDPGRFVYTSNVLAHRQTLADIPFDETFAGWGWEDVDWGLRVANEAPVVHIDNPATHMGLDTADILMRKYGRSGPNFVRALEKHPASLAGSPLGRHSATLAKLPRFLCAPIKFLAGTIARDDLMIMPVFIRGNALKLWRALIYAEARR